MGVCCMLGPKHGHNVNVNVRTGVGLATTKVHALAQVRQVYAGQVKFGKISCNMM